MWEKSLALFRASESLGRGLEDLRALAVSAMRIDALPAPRPSANAANFGPSLEYEGLADAPVAHPVRVSLQPHAANRKSFAARSAP
jgi:hypothetical protein